MKNPIEESDVARLANAVRTFLSWWFYAREPYESVGQAELIPLIRALEVLDGTPLPRPADVNAKAELRKRAKTEARPE